MALELFTPKDLSPALTQEIVRFLDSQTTSHPFQFPQWADSGTRFALLRRENRILWFANCGTQFPLGTRLAGFRAMSVNRGPVCDDREVWRAGLNELLERMRGEGLVYLNVVPDWLQEPEPQSIPDISPDWNTLGNARFSLRLDVTKTPDELLAQLRKNTRYEVRRAERAAITAGPSKGQGDIEAFLDLYVRLAQRKGFSADSPDHLRSILGWLIAEPARGALLLARVGSSVAGGAVIARSGKRCWYLWGASDRHEQFSAGHALQWQAIPLGKVTGLHRIRFRRLHAGGNFGSCLVQRRLRRQGR